MPRASPVWACAQEESIASVELGYLRTLMMRSRNLKEFLASACRLAANISLCSRYAVCVSGDTARFHHESMDAGNTMHGHLLSLGVTVNMLRTLAGEAWMPADIVVPSGTSDGLADISEAFESARVDPSATSAPFTFPRSFLSMPGQARGCWRTFVWMRTSRDPTRAASVMRCAGSSSASAGWIRRRAHDGGCGGLERWHSW